MDRKLIRLFSAVFAIAFLSVFISQPAPAAYTRVSVSSFGAKGDGTTNDRAAIQAAIDALATSGGVVELPAGTFYCATALTISSSAGITLRGQGDATVIKSNTASEGNKLAITGSNVSVERIKFNGGYTSGSNSGDFGLVNITDGDKVAIRNCTFINSLDRAIRIRGGAEDIEISGNTFSNHFETIHSTSTGNSAVPQRISIRGNSFKTNWGSGAESGAIKLQNTHTPRSSGHVVADNIIIGTGQMGIECWSSIGDTSITGNTISTVDFGISLDGTVRTVVSGNSISLCTYSGIESATNTADNVIASNVVSMYNAAGSRAGSYGIVTSNTTPYRILIKGNTVRGCAGPGIQIQTTDYAQVLGNSVSDCSTLINLKTSDYVEVRGNFLHAPSQYHLFVDANDANMTDIAIEGNTLSGLAPNDNIIFYDGAGTHTITRLTLRFNNLGSATYSNLSANYNVPTSRMPYHFVFGNYSIPGSGQASWPDGGRTDQLPIPFFSADQGGGIPVAKRFEFTVASSGADQWFKVFSRDIGTPITVPIHVRADAVATDNKATTVTAIVTGSPYGQDGGILKIPTGGYNGGMLKGIIYNNPSAGSVQDIWLRFGATGGGDVEVLGSDFSDSWITSPSAVTSEPSWSANKYEADLSANHKALTAPGIVTSAPTGGTAAQWKLGDYTAGAPTADGYLLIQVGNDTYKLSADKQ